MSPAARASWPILALACTAAFVGPVLADAPPETASPAERRAVRGVPVEESLLSESEELRDVRRFGNEAFPRHRGPGGVLPEEVGDHLPAGLAGRWGGSGDIPPQLRSPQVSRRTDRPGPEPPADWLRGLAAPEFPVRWEPQVVRWLEFFGKEPRGRAIMSSFLRRLGRYQRLYGTVFDRHGLPRDLVYLAMIESGFEPGAVSRVGAGGVWQFMPRVARAYGLEVGHWVDARRDPEQAAEAAARFLKDLHVRFGHWHLAMAAYHAGYAGILRSISRFNTNDYWELCRHEAGLPWETTHYVPKILAAAIIGHNRSAFGFGDVAPDPPWEYETVEVPAGTTLAAVARATGAAVEVVQGLNPELIRARTPPDRGLSRVRVPVGTAAIYAESGRKGQLAPEGIQTVVLRFGESLEDLAKTHGISLRDLKKLNGLKDSGEARAGTTVVVPARAVPVAAETAEADDTILVSVPEREFRYPGKERVFYRTRDGDALEEIADAFGVESQELAEWNALDPEAKLHAGLVLQVFVPRDFDRGGVALLDPTKVVVVTLGSEEFLSLEAARRGKTRLHYVARAGDTLAKIARRYGLAPGDLARINRLSYSAELSEGQRVVVYSPTPQLPREIAVGRKPTQRRPVERGPSRPAASAKGASSKSEPPSRKSGPGRPAAKATASPGKK